MKHRIRSHEEMMKKLEEFKEFAKSDPEAARIVARVALIKTGVLNEDGTAKEQIIDYPHSLTYEPDDMPKGRVRKK